MSKRGGLGMNCYVGGYNLSGDVGAFDKISCGIKTFDKTGIDKSAHERIRGQADGGVDWKSFFNDDANQAHPVLKALPTTDVHIMGTVGTLIGDRAFGQVSKQSNYDGIRSDDGDFNFKLSALANAYGLEWGKLLTAGIRTDVAATNGASIDTTASAAFGAQAYLQVFAFSGTDVTIKIQDSADDSSFLDVADLSFTQVTASRVTERKATAIDATVRRYLRAVTVTTGGFASVQFAVTIVKNKATVQF